MQCVKLRIIKTLRGVTGTQKIVKMASQGMTTRQAFVMTVMVWIALSAFGALPFYWSGLVPTYTDAFFESISGLTTTGATVMTGLDTMPPGILLWRGILQWLGGLGIIVMAVAVLPMLQIGGMQLFTIGLVELNDDGSVKQDSEGNEIPTYT